MPGSASRCCTRQWRGRGSYSSPSSTTGCRGPSSDTTIEPGLIDILVPASSPLVEYRTPALSPIEEAIAANVARLVPDRATIELGYGAIPEAVTRALGRKDGARASIRARSATG